MRTCRHVVAALAAALLAWPLLAAPAAAQIEKQGPPARRAGSAIDYAGVLRMLEQGATQKEILRKLEESPTTFVLSEDQVATLRAKGATPAVLAAMMRLSGQGIHSDVRNIGIVLDCSGSMLDRLPDGKAKIDVAKQVVTNFIRRIKNGKNLTFVVYGLDPRGKKCRDVDVVLPLSTLTDDVKADLEKKIQDIVPLGYTPLAYSMEVVGEQLARQPGVCMLVVVTDGMETCKGDPSAVAEMLTKRLVLPGGVDVIGLGVPPEEMRWLEQKAREGKFRLHEADKADELERQLKDAEEKARRELAERLKQGGEQAVADAQKAQAAALQAQQSAQQARAAARKVETATPAARQSEDAAVKALQAAAAARKAADEALRARQTEDVAGPARDAAGHRRDAEAAAEQARLAMLRAQQEANQAGTSTVRGQAGEEPEPTKVAGLDPLPGEGRIKWDVRVLEDNPEHFGLVRRTTTADSVSWVVRAKSDQAVQFVHNLERSFTQDETHVLARFLDADDAQVTPEVVRFRFNTRDISKGQNVRLTVMLPRGDAMKRTARVEVQLTKNNATSRLVVPLPARGAGAGTVRAQAGEEPAQEGAKLDPLPGGGRIKWDVRVLEDNPEHFGLVRRITTPNSVSWVVRAKSDQAVQFVRNLERSFTQDETHVMARFLDADDAQVTPEIVRFQFNTRDISKGQNVRLTVMLPRGDAMSRTARVEVQLTKSRPTSRLVVPLPAGGAGIR